MCIAIYKPADKVITKETLELCFNSNKDGCGFAYINTSHTGDKKIVIKKSLDFDTFYRQYKRATEVDASSPFLIHFRIKTHGEVSKFNCHPFKIDNRHAFIHNGIISGVGADARKSDTQLFNEKILRNLEGNWNYNPAIKTLVEEMIGYSKLVVLNLDGDVQIYNEGKGKWDDGVWYSNESYKPRVFVQQQVFKNFNNSYSNNYSNTFRTGKIKGSSPEIEFYVCDECGISRYKASCSFFNTDTNIFSVYCTCCAEKIVKEGSLYPSDKISKDIYDTYGVKEPLAYETSAYYIPEGVELTC